MLSYVLAIVLAQAPAVADNPHPWKELRSGPNMRLWSRDVENSEVREVRATSIIPAPPERVWEVITDIDHYTEFMPYIIEGRVVAKDDDGSQLEYMRLEPPLVDKRDYTLKLTSHQDPEKGVYSRHWTTSNDRGPPPRSDHIRLELCDGSWTLRRTPDGKTQVTYWLYTNPGGSVPAWIANQANTRSLPDLLKAVHKRSVDPSWTR